MIPVAGSSRSGGLLHIFGVPALLAVIMAIGFTSALLGDALIWKAIAWVGLAAPVGVALWRIVVSLRGPSQS